MISSSYDLAEFIRTIQDKDYLDMIYLADKEATEAERQQYLSRRSFDSRQSGCKRYADMLKDFIFFMRYGVKPSHLPQEGFQLFLSVCENLLQKRTFHSPCRRFVRHERVQ